MSDIRALIIGIVGSLIVIGIKRLSLLILAKNRIVKIKELEDEKNFINKAKNSIYTLNRFFFFMTSVIFILIGIINVIPYFLSVSKITIPSNVIEWCLMMLWLFVIGVGLGYAKSYFRLADPNKAIEKLDQEIITLKEKQND